MANIKIQLVDTNEGYLDLAEDTNFPLTLSVSDIRDITKRQGTFSKTIKLSGSKNNNQLLNKYFDVNVVAGTFNINTLQSCIVLEDNIPILENAYMQLLSVKKIQATNQHEQFVEYEVVIKDSIGDFFTKLGNAELTDLDFSEYNTTFNAANVVASFSNTVEDGFKFVMPQNITSNTYKLEEWLPGIYAKQYWDKIFGAAGYEYEWDSLTGSTIQFDKLIVPYNGDQSKLNEENKELLEVIVENNGTTNYTISQASNGTTIPFTQALLITGETKDLQGYFDLALVKYTNALTISAPSSLNISLDVEFDFILKNQTASSVSLITGGKYKPTITVRKNNSNVGAINIPLNQTYTSFITSSMSGTPTSLAVGENIIYSSNVNVSGNMTGLVPSDFLNFRTTLLQSGVSQWTGRVDPIIRIKSITMTITPNIDVLGYSYPVFLNNFIPKKIKQSDFIKSFVSLYNLYIDVDKTNRNKLIIKTRDNFYDAGTVVNWTKKLNKNLEQKLTFLPDLSKKKIKLTYKQDDSDENLKTYLSATNEIYGQQEFTFDNEYIKDVDTKEILFSPTVITTTSFGAVTPTINGTSPKNNIRLLFDGGNFSCNTFKIIDYVNGTTEYGELTNTQYPLFSHFNHPTDPTFDINFGMCDYYAYPSLNITNNNMYNLHWRRTMNQINENKMLVAYFDLNGVDIYKTKLNDKIRIDNSYWNINQIIDYNPSKSGPTKVELISIDDELKLAPFKRKITKPKFEKPIFSKPIRDLEAIRFKELNVNSSIASNIIGFNNQISTNILGATIVGNNNNIEGNSIVFGDNNTDTTKNALIIGDSNIVDSVGVIVGTNNTILEGLDGVSIFGNGITATTGNTLYTNNIVLSSGGTLNGVAISAITNMVLTSGDTYVTGGTYAGGTLTLTRNDAVDITVTGFTTGGSGPYLPTSGGTMTGDIIMSPQKYLKNSGSTATVSLGVIGDQNRIDLVQYNGDFANTITLKDDIQLNAYDDFTGENHLQYVDANNGFTFEDSIGSIFGIKRDGVKIIYTPTTVNTNAKVLTRNATTGVVELRDASTIGSGTYLNLSGGTVTGNLVVNGNLSTGGNLLADDFEQTSHAQQQTTNATVTTIKTIPISTEYVYQIEANVVGGINDTSKGITSKILGSFKNNGGTVTQIGKQNIIMNTDFTGTADVTMTISGTNVLVRVTGEASTTVDWGCSIIINRMAMGVI